ncbi:MAG: hypothetical protein H7641_03085 [Candidatus Heimdallarchaeota archaeon]|nr:hypothetical protein [Candidatus Heimdallarchaeota archaeon]MCK4876549.1 hypothetical protein [Candidatus Heimdallarchaeota archaeon]
MSTSGDYSILKQEIQETMKSYTELLETISEKNSNEINRTLWKIRADLETIVVDFKNLITDSLLKENWQEKFHSSFKGTKSKEKAVSKLQEYSLSVNEIMALFAKKKNECYQYLWKLKEVISAVISAFPETRFKWVNNQLQEEKEEIFEI